MKLKTTKQIELEFDTDHFTPVQWKEFITQNLSHREIANTIGTDLFWRERLKERAIQVYQARQEFNLFD